MKSKLLIQFAWLLVLLGFVSLSLWLSFQIHVLAKYHFSFFYDFYNISEHIQKFAPQNYYKLGFDTLSKHEHVKLFSLIVDAVHQHSVKLEEIIYTVQGREIPLLTPAEITHLKDVSNLIIWINQLMLFILPATLLPFLWLLHHRYYPNWFAQLAGLLLLSALIGISLFVIGAEAVFYQLHVWIFPDNHQWFFYYQESLMSTLMKAPLLFAGIAWVILLLALVFFLSLIALIVIYQGMRQPSHKRRLNGLKKPN